MEVQTFWTRVVAGVAITSLTVAVSAGTAAAGTVVEDQSTVAVTAESVQDAIEQLPSALLVEPVESLEQTEGSAVAEVGDGVQIEVPLGASAPVELDFGDAESPIVQISLPEVALEAGGEGEVTEDGVVAFAGDAGAATAVVPTEEGDGGVQMLTVIAEPLAPTSYEYEVEVPDGGSVQLTDDGGAVVLDGAGELLLAVPAPWAKDADGAPVPTRFELSEDGTGLVQVVEHASGEYAYPVTADPIWFVVSMRIFWWAVQRCGAGGSLGAAAAYIGGSRSAWALSGQAAIGCITAFVGDGWKVRQMIRTLRW